MPDKKRKHDDATVLQAPGGAEFVTKPLNPDDSVDGVMVSLVDGKGDSSASRIDLVAGQAKAGHPYRAATFVGEQGEHRFSVLMKGNDFKFVFPDQDGQVYAVPAEDVVGLVTRIRGDSWRVKA